MSLNELAGRYTVDPTHSTIGFVARHAMISKVRGSFQEFEAEFNIPEGGLSASEAQASIQVNSIDTRNAQRDEHLRTGDFFNAEEFPEITFKSTKVEATGDEGAFELTGDLTIKGVTQPVTLQVEFTGTAVDPYGNQRAGFEATTTIARKDFGMTFNAALETGGVLISEKIAIELEISAIKQA